MLGERYDLLPTAGTHLHTSQLPSIPDATANLSFLVEDPPTMLVSYSSTPCRNTNIQSS